MAGAPLHVVVLCEARDVLCELRGNRRFAYLPSFVSAAPAEHPLVDDVKRVRDVVRAARAPPLPPDALARALDPLLRIVQSRDTSGNITGVALQSLDRIAAAALAAPPAALPAYAPVLSALVAAVASCRFDASDPAKDEVVLARITRVIARVATSPRAAPLLADAAILHGFDSCLDIAAGRRRTSDLLKRTAEATLVDIAAAVAAHAVAPPPPAPLSAHADASADADAARDAAPAAARLRADGHVRENGDAHGAAPPHARPAAAAAAAETGSDPDPARAAPHDALVAFDFDAAPASPSSAAIASYMTGAAFGPPFDIAAHAQRGPATVDAVGALLELACKMADPSVSHPAMSPVLGLQIVSAILSAGGERLRTHPTLRRLLVRECSRAILRAVGTFAESPAFISAAFNAASHLVHALGPDGTAFLSDLLQKVFPYYISSYEGVMPRMCSPADLASILPHGASSASSAAVGAAAAAALNHVDMPSGVCLSGSDQQGQPLAGGNEGLNGNSMASKNPSRAGKDGVTYTSQAAVDRASPRNSARADGYDESPFDDGDAGVEDLAGRTAIDPIVREIGLEALCSLISTPGLLAAIYQVTDCSLSCGDVVTTLLLALGGATNSRYFRRRSKRLRASSGGSLSAVAIADHDDSDEEEEDDGSGLPASSSEEARHARGAALLCAETIMAIVDAISERMRNRGEPIPDSTGCADVVSMADVETNDNTVTPRQADVSRGARQSGYEVETPIDLHAGDIPPVSRLRENRARKRHLQKTADAFNDPAFSASSASKALRLLAQYGLAENTPAVMKSGQEQESQVAAIVQFLRETPGLQKDKIGGILGEPDALSQAVLSAYTNTFDFEDRPFTECLRIFLESFRLPGEAQKIDRIMESFAARFFSQNQPLDASPAAEVTHMDASKSASSADGFEQNGLLETAGGKTASKTMQPTHPSSRGVFANADAVFTLSFAVVMLNTDQHNPAIRKKMTVDSFVQNLRDINGGKDFPRWFLADVFSSIAAVEMRMSDEAGMGGLTDLHWDEQLRDMFGNGRVLPDVSQISPLDEDIFQICWPACVSSASVVLNEASDAGSAQKALEGLLNVARCGAAFRRSEPTDTVVSVLTMATAVREGPLYGAAVRFGTDIKAQMASVALSGVARQCGDWMRASGWMSLVAYILRLHALNLLPYEMEDAIGGYGVDLTGADGTTLPPSTLIPSWWPSQQLSSASRESDPSEPSKAAPQRKQPKMNSFFALLAASISGDPASDDEPESGDETPPSYLKMRSEEDAEAEDLARKCVSACRIDDVLLNEAKVLRPEALSCLAQALAYAANEVLDGDPQMTVSEENGSRLSLASSGLRADLGGHAVDDDREEKDGGSSRSPPGESDKTSHGKLIRESSIITGTAKILRSSGSYVEGDVDSNGYGAGSSIGVSIRGKDERKARSSIVAFCIDTLCELTLQNRDRLYIPWPALHGILLRVIDKKTRSIALLERAVVALLRVANRLLHREEVRSDVIRGLNLIVNLPSSTAEELSVPVAAGVYNIVKAFGGHISSISGWHALLSIIENSARFSSVARDISFQSLSFLLTDDRSVEAVSTETFAPLLEAVLAYTSCPSLDVSMQSLELLCALSKRIPKLVDSGREESNVSGSSDAQSLESISAPDRAWTEYWGPLMRGFADAARDPRGKVRNTALAALERVIATGGPAGSLTALQWEAALSSVLLPLMNDLFKSSGLLQVTVEAERLAQRKLLDERNAVAPAPRSRGARNAIIRPEHDAQLMKTVKAACDRTRLRAVMLVSKTFLQHHARIAEGLSGPAFTEIWLGILGTFGSALEGGPRVRGVPDGPSDGEIREHVPESVKNILLVMCASGLLDKDAPGNRWEATFRLLRKCLPEMELEEFVLRASSPISPGAGSRPTEPPRGIETSLPTAPGDQVSAADVVEESENTMPPTQDCGTSSTPFVPPSQVVMTPTDIA